MQLNLLPDLAEKIYNVLLEYHGLKLYCASICQPLSLSRTWKNGKRLLNPVLIKKAFDCGKLKVMYVKTWVDAVINIPAGEDVVSGVWSISNYFKYYDNSYYSLMNKKIN